MPSHSLDQTKIAALLSPYVSSDGQMPPGVYEKLADYLDVLLKWNARTNLTAIRKPEEIVRRHFGESLFVGQNVGPCTTLLDFGSGAGFPGLPIQLLRPELKVTLAESQNKKSTFLREVVRTLSLKTEVWADRVEAMPSSRIFDVVALRAVDHMDEAVGSAAPRASRALAIMTSGKQKVPLVPEFSLGEEITVPGDLDLRLILLLRDFKD